MLRGKGIGSYKVVRDGRGRFAKHVGDDSIEGHIADGKNILETILFAGFAGNKLKPITGVLPQDSDRFTGDKTAGNKAEVKQVADPFRIFLIIFVAFYCLDPFGIGNGNVDGILKQIEYWHPIFPRRFHADIEAVVVKQPLLELQDGIIKGGKSLLLIAGRNPLRSDNSGDEKFFMDIDAAAGGINDFQATASHWLIYRFKSKKSSLLLTSPCFVVWLLLRPILSQLMVSAYLVFITICVARTGGARWGLIWVFICRL